MKSSRMIHELSARLELGPASSARVAAQALVVALVMVLELLAGIVLDAAERAASGLMPLRPLHRFSSTRRTFRHDFLACLASPR